MVFRLAFLTVKSELGNMSLHWVGCVWFLFNFFFFNPFLKLSLIILRERSHLYTEVIYMKFKNWQNQIMVIEIRIVVASGRNFLGCWEYFIS